MLDMEIVLDNSIFLINTNNINKVYMNPQKTNGNKNELNVIFTQKL